MRETVFLTGLPSLLARTLADALLTNPDVQLRALVRSRSLDTVRAWLEEKHPGALGERVTLFEGDPWAMDHGLSGAEFRAIASEVDIIHHAAHVEHLGANGATAERLHVAGTREALELAREAPRLRAFVHHSSAYVSGDRRGLVLETELDVGQKARNVAEATRFEAEKIIQRASKQLPIVVMRPSTLVGDSRIGEVDRLDGPYLLILLVLTTPTDLPLPLPTEGDALLQTVPVDWVARTAITIGHDPKAIGHTFHLVDPNPLTIRRASEAIARVAGKPEPRGHIPSNITKALLSTPGLDRFLRSPRAFLEQLATRVRYNARHARQLFGEGPWLEPPPFESYVEAMVNHVRERVGTDRIRWTEAEDPWM